MQLSVVKVFLPSIAILIPICFVVFVLFLLEDNNGWSLQFDKHYTKDKYSKLKSLYAFQTKTPECCK